MICRCLFKIRPGFTLLLNAVLASFLLSSCITTPLFLKKGEYLLISQRAKGHKNVPTEELELLYRQKANRQILGTTPYLAFYFFGKSIWDTTRIRKKINQKEAYYDAKIRSLPDGALSDSLYLEARKEKKCKKLYQDLYEGNWWMRVVGEEPAIYDSVKSRQTRDEISKYLFNKGYFNNEVRLREDTFLGGNLAVRYIIKENQPFRIRRFDVITDDYRLAQILDSLKGQFSCKVDNAYQKDHIVADRELIEKTLRNKGYLTFSREYVIARVDTGASNPISASDSLLARRKPHLFTRFGLDLKLIVRNPDEGRHKAYVLDSVQFTLNESDSSKIGGTRQTRVNGITFHTQSKIQYSLGILDSKILVRPGQFFHYSRMTNTQAQLTGMDMFRYVNLSLDTHSQNKVRIAIVANRLPKYQMSNELGMLMSQGAPGPYINVGFKIRNIFGGFEVFEINTRYSQEGQLSTFLPKNVVFRARDLSITSSFTISKILFPISLGTRLYEFNPKTRYIFSLNALKRPEYIRNLVKGALSYSLQLSPTRQIGVSPVDVTVNVTPKDALNPTYLEQLIQFSGLGQSVLQSFQTAVVTNFNAYYMYNDNVGGARKKSRYFRLNVEYGGELLHQVLKRVLNKENNTIGDFRLFRYARSTADFRIYRPAGKNTVVAFRLAGGAALPLEPSRVLPWEKYNFAGGSNSIRAWLPRRLGPGSYAPADADPNNLQTEQPGEIILESSLELRQKLFSFFEGAAFIDAGNVWNFSRDPARPGAEISPLFLRQLAVGGGLGLRMDFSFLIVRIDAATKIYNPAFTNELDKWTIKNLSWKKPLGSRGQTLFNVGIGYPF